MKKLFLLLISTTFLVASSLPIESIVKIHTSTSTADYKYPWQTSKIFRYVGSGAIIDGNRILTSAHVVSGAKFLEVQKENDPKKYIANVKYISHQADLAIVEVQDAGFFKGTKPLKLNENVKPRDEITVLGYPLGGQSISTTTGVISRIEYTSYVWSAEQLLAIQVDAAINSGNSGGPAIDKNGDIVGISMMSLKNASNISYIVPSVIINTFLTDVEDGKVDGFGEDGLSVNFIRNDSVKEYFGLQDGSGILITKVDYGVKDFKENDILLEIDGKAVANDGTIESQFGRVNASLLMHKKQIGDTLNIKVLRDKKIVSFTHTIERLSPLIVYEFEKEPRYCIFGGLAFTPLTKNYISAISDKASGINMLFYKKGKTEDFDEPVVWMQTIFPHNVNRGYWSGAFVVETVNGVKVKNFKHFIQLIDNLDTQFVVIETMENQKIILNVKEARESYNDLKRIYYLNSDRRVD
ncbi:S1C family serine protease [Sulfurimonas xiamenensis]|uniref:S1C family serine protease n=1 Tax=Sulfurimonas xiamenensis TaxID=2590021 RepID=UPI00165ECA5B|nr:S1C family serine protease [Sulfurimonas xiamenensis]